MNSKGIFHLWMSAEWQLLPTKTRFVIYLQTLVGVNSKKCSVLQTWVSKALSAAQIMSLLWLWGVN
jgi:hypothetical protein